MGPKNRNAKLASDGKPQKQVTGTHVRYIGMGDKWYVCSVCDRRFLRGFFWESEGKSGCTQRCLKKQL